MIPSIIVDPRNPDVVLVAAEGNLVAKSEMRGVYRSTDGGKSWSRTLFVNDSTGVQKLARAFDRPDVIFATTIRHYNPPVPPSGISPRRRHQRPAAPAGRRRPPRASTSPPTRGRPGPSSRAAACRALNGCEYVAVAQNTNAQRVFVIGNNGLFRSDDGGTTWRQMAPDDTRIRNGQGGYNCGVYVDTRNPDVVYTINTSSYVSTDGGKTFTGFKGAPGGDDPQQMWIDPTNGERIFLGYDQGAIVTLDGGTTWSSWYNQSTEQVYHVSTDNSLPVLDLRHAAGRRRDPHAQPRQLRRDHAARLESPCTAGSGARSSPIRSTRTPCTRAGIGHRARSAIRREQWINVSPAANPDLHLRTTSSQPICSRRGTSTSCSPGSST